MRRSTNHTWFKKRIREQFHNIYMAGGFPSLKREHRYWKCVIALSTQRGSLADAYRNILDQKKMSISRYCDHGCDQMYSPLSLPIHDEIKIPAHCLTWELFEKILQRDKILKKYLEGHPDRIIFIRTLFEMCQKRLERTMTYDKGMYC